VKTPLSPSTEMKVSPMELKSQLHHLAIMGGPPAFPEPLHTGRPNIGDRHKLLARINDLLDRRWFTNNGPFVREFERRVEETLQVRNCIAMCNGTVALQIAIRAMGLTGEVIVPAFTFIATPHALHWQGVTPVFCDVDPRTHTLDPGQVERMITPRTTGIVGVHVWGNPCAIDALTELSRWRNLPLLFDASHAFCCSYRGQMIGNFGSAEVFSFHATKFFNTFEGGAVVTNDDALAAKIRLMKNFGFAGYDEVIHIGMNGKMSEVCAAMGLTGLESLQTFITTNRHNYITYREAFRSIPGLQLFQYNDGDKHNYQYIVLEVDEDVTGIGRDVLIKVLHSERILARRYFYPGCHRMEPYISFFPDAGLRLPETERLCRRVLVLPTGTAVHDAEICTIAQVLRLAIKHGEELSALTPSRMHAVA
jgi:dTDP-4-amino-4,6-dideoxygalactose transaminase